MVDKGFIPFIKQLQFKAMRAGYYKQVYFTLTNREQYWEARHLALTLVQTGTKLNYPMNDIL